MTPAPWLPKKGLKHHKWAEWLGLGWYRCSQCKLEAHRADIKRGMGECHPPA